MYQRSLIENWSLAFASHITQALILVKWLLYQGCTVVVRTFWKYKVFYFFIFIIIIFYFFEKGSVRLNLKFTYAPILMFYLLCVYCTEFCYAGKFLFLTFWLRPKIRRKEIKKIDYFLSSNMITFTCIFPKFPKRIE